MPQQISTTSDFQGLFKFLVDEYIAGFYRKTITLKKGQGYIISNLKGDKALLVPASVTIDDLGERLQNGDFVTLKYLGDVKSKSGFEYKNIKSWAWKLSDEEAKEWDSKNCNIPQLLEALDREGRLNPEGGSKKQEEHHLDPPVDDDDLPF